MAEHAFPMGAGLPEVDNPKISLRQLSVRFGDHAVLRDVSFDVEEFSVTAIIGPQGARKSTLLSAINRMNDLDPQAVTSGEVLIDGRDIYAPKMDVAELRARVGMVFQTPMPFPKSVYENVAYGPQLHKLAQNREELEAIIEMSLKRAGLWDEVKDGLSKPALALDAGQQQRLCIARAIAVDPEVILMDEPSAKLDALGNARLEELMEELKQNYTVLLATRSLQQAMRVSSRTAFLYEGQLVEYGLTADIFTNPRQERTRNYITGRLG